MEPECRFALRWEPQALEAEADLGDYVSTLVEFLLEGDESGTRLSVSESGFDQLPEKGRVACFKRNEQGWTIQVENIRHHVNG